MKIALLGNGKTGKYIKEKAQDVLVFDSKTPLKANLIQECDVVICFVTSEILDLYIDELILSKKPVVIASTGKEFAKDLTDKIATNKLKWIYSSNFSKSLLLYKVLVQCIATHEDIHFDMTAQILDIHHKDKKDAPSGTALTIKKWYGKDIDITSIREDDHIGTHTFILSNKDEEIKLTHTIKDRSVFAKGAIKAAELILKSNKVGLQKFYEVINE